MNSTPTTYLDVQMDNVVFMHMLKTKEELSDVLEGLGFVHCVAIIDDTVEQFTTGEAVKGDGGGFTYSCFFAQHRI